MSMVFTNAGILVGGQQLNTVANAVALSYGADALANDVLAGPTTKIKAGGLKKVGLSLAGFWDTLLDPAMYADVGLADVATIVPQGMTEGNIDYFVQVLEAMYGTGTEVGKLLPFKYQADVTGPLVRGTLVANKSGISANGNGTGFNLGAVAAGQKLYAAAHVISLTGATPSITLAVQGDTSNAFAAPVTEITFAAATAVGAQFLSLAGALTQTWYRLVWTVNSPGTFAFVASLGIQ